MSIGLHGPFCSACGHPLSSVYRGICFGLVDGATDVACGCRAIGPDGQYYPEYEHTKWQDSVDKRAKQYDTQTKEKP